MGLKKSGILLGASKLPESLFPAAQLVSSMKYTVQELRELNSFEVEFIRMRCKELHISGFDEMITLIAEVSYDEKGNKMEVTNDSNRSIA